MTIVEEFASKTKNSKRLWGHMAQVLPQGVTRTVAFFKPHPIVIDHGSGARIWDADGNEYIDLLNNHSALIHGHAHPEICKAASEVVAKGTVFPAPHIFQEDHARMLVNRIPSADMVRYQNSGTEAIMYAVRLARALTKRDVIVKAIGGYHGTWDAVWCYVGGQKSFDGGIGEPQPGIPKDVHNLTKTYEFNNRSSLSSVCKGIGKNLAAIIIEPMLVAGGVIPGDPEFLRECRRLCDELGALLIFDEVQTFRLAWGGMQEWYDVSPDITALGKIIGGGFPVGAVAGKQEILSSFIGGSSTYVNHSGTFNGNLMTMKCGAVALKLLDRKAIERINAFGDKISSECQRMIKSHGLAGCVTGHGSIRNYHMGVEEVNCVSDTHNEDLKLMDMFHLSLLLNGLFMANRGYFNISTALTEIDIDEILDRIDRALARVSKEV